MSLLTDDEINEIADKCKAFSGGVWPHAFYEYAEAMILAKLSGMVLPEPDNHSMYGYTKEHIRQAYAQGAASQLAQEPSGFIARHDLKMLSEGYPATVVMLAGFKRNVPLFTQEDLS